MDRALFLTLAGMPLLFGRLDAGFPAEVQCQHITQLVELFNMNDYSILSNIFSVPMEIIMIFLLNSFNMLTVV